MRRTFAAALVAALTAGTAAANPGPNTFGLGCGGWALHMFPRIHQHGPLFNYGPYYGYPPFEPYGPWDAYLRYQGGYGGGGGNMYGWIHGGHPGSHLHGHQWGSHSHHGCATCGGNHHSHHYTPSAGCGSCGAAAAAVVTSGPALARFNGYGNPAANAAFYAESPALVLPASGTTAP